MNNKCHRRNNACIYMDEVLECALAASMLLDHKANTNNPTDDVHIFLNGAVEGECGKVASLL